MTIVIKLKIMIMNNKSTTIKRLEINKTITVSIRIIQKNPSNQKKLSTSHKIIKMMSN